MDRNERARRRAAFGRLWEADAQARSLAHGLELEEEAEQEEAAVEPPWRHRTTGRLVAIAAIGVFAMISLCILVVMADRFETQAFMRDHGVATQAVIIDKMYSPHPHRTPGPSYSLGYRFWPRSPGRRAGSSVEAFDIVPLAQYSATEVGQIVAVRYNPNRLSQSMLYFGPPPTDQEMIGRDALLLGLWVILFGGICALIVALAWPDAAQPGAWFGRTRQAKPLA